MKKLGVMILALFAVVAALIYVSSTKEESEEEYAGVEAKNINDVEFLKGAYLFVPEGYERSDEEILLENLSTKHDFSYEKVLFDKDAVKFMEKQEEIVTVHYPKAMELANEIFVTVVEEKEVFDEALSEEANNLLEKMQDGENIEEGIKQLAEKSGKDLGKFTSYFEERKSLSEVIVLKPLTKEDGLTVLFFNKGTEYARVHLNQPTNVSLEWLLVDKGLLSLSENSDLTWLKNDIELGLSDEEYSEDYLVAFATHICDNCENTIDNAEKVADEKDLEFRYIDAGVFNNREVLEEFTTKHLATSLETSPTVTYIHNGKEIGRFVGIQSKATIEKFVRDMQSKIKKESEKTADSE